MRKAKFTLEQAEAVCERSENVSAKCKNTLGKVAKKIGYIAQFGFDCSTKTRLQCESYHPDFHRNLGNTIVFLREAMN